MKSDNYSDSKHVIEAKTKFNNQKNIISRKITRELYTEKIGQDNTTEIFKWFTQIIMRCNINGIFPVKLNSFEFANFSS